MDKGNLSLRDFFGLDRKNDGPYRNADWKKRLRVCGYDVVAPNGAVWKFSHGEWTSTSYPGTAYDTEDLAEYFADIEDFTA